MSGEPDNTGTDTDGPGLPGGLIQALKELDSAPIPVARLRDEAVLADAARALDRRRALATWRFRALAAAAAMVLVGAAVWIATRPVGGQGNPTRLAADVDADGRVDIVDAMVLAADVRAGRRGAGADVNGDGVIDGRDVEAVAHLAVRLNRGGA